MKIVRIIAPILIICLLLSGCSTRQSLSDLTIVEMVGIDYENGKTKILLQYLNLAKSGGTTDGINSNITSVASGTADNISSAISNASSALSQEIFFGQNKVILFGREFVENGVDKGLDYLLRSVDSRPDVLVAMASDKAEKVINSPEREARIPAESIYNLLETGEQNGFGAVVSVNDLLNMYSDKTGDVYLPVIKAEKDSCLVDGIAIFSKEKYKKSLDKNQSLGFLILKNKVKNGFINVSDNDLGNVSLEFVSSKAKCNLEKSENGYKFSVKIKMKLTLDEVENGITTAIDEKKIKEVEKLVNKRVSQLCSDAFNACIMNKSDALMLGRYLAKSDENEYKSKSDSWRENLKNIKLEISVNSDLEKVNDTALRG